MASVNTTASGEPILGSLRGGRVSVNGQREDANSFFVNDANLGDQLQRCFDCSDSRLHPGIRLGYMFSGAALVVQMSLILALSSIDLFPQAVRAPEVDPEIARARIAAIMAQAWRLARVRSAALSFGARPAFFPRCCRCCQLGSAAVPLLMDYLTSPNAQECRIALDVLTGLGKEPLDAALTKVLGSSRSPGGLSASTQCIGRGIGM